MCIELNFKTNQRQIAILVQSKYRILYLYVNIFLFKKFVGINYFFIHCTHINKVISLVSILLNKSTDIAYYKINFIKIRKRKITNMK